MTKRGLAPLILRHKRDREQHHFRVEITHFRLVQQHGDGSIIKV